ncbi:polymeric immunoglobulin receptor isoform X33 [Astyanax mexicanus]|uniref:polymeric immunoglobulin receptor isoform X33 n=1 Tax=Astyanax mexicanus TaxID=7994 RepID=UPI0020CAA1AF|nr:polymeric immunoglobulin receptor isoform X33 [Astyanax mexicanus]
MKQNQRLMLLWVYLLYCVLHEISGCSVSRGVKAPITKSVGDSVVLPCSCEDLQHKPNTLMWGYTKRIALGNYKAEHSVFPEDREQSQRYRGRVQRLTQNPPGDLSLIISHLTEEDEGLYLCGVNEKYTTAVPLYIRGCSVMNEGENSFIKSPGESVLLPCFCPEDRKINPQRVTWFFSKPGSEDKISVSNETQSYSGRVWMFDQPKSRNFSLLISDLNKDDSGEYRCRADENNVAKYAALEVKGCTLSENKQTVPIIRSSGESVLLSCSCTDLQDSPERVQWRTPDHEDLFSTELHQRYRDRVQTFKQNSPGNLSVLISDLTVEDGGTYSCWINQNQHRTFSLTVKGCTLSNSQENQIVRYPGESVLLPCSCTDPQTRPVSIKWEHVDSNGTEVSNITERYAGRIHMFNEKHPANLSLLLFNLTKQDNGTYRCTINNEKSISMKLNVKDCTLSSSQETPIVGQPGNTTFEMNWTYWTPILSCVFLILLLLLGAAAYIFCKHRKGKRRSGKETEQRGNKEDDITYSSIAHGKKAKPPNTEDNITYASIAHGKKAKPPKTEDDVIYSSVVHDKKAKPTQRQAEEDVTYADVAFRRKSKKAEKQNNVTFSSEACKSERDTEEPTVYASVKTTKK